MGVNENERTASLSPDGDALAADGWKGRYRGHTLRILIIALLVAEISKDVVSLLLSVGYADWLPVSGILYLGAIAGMPFLLARMAPKAAGFDTQWLPASRRHWVWFAGMIFLLCVARVAVAALAATIAGSPSPRPSTGPVTPMAFVLFGIMAISVVPVAEEIFFRGYVQDQLRKLAPPGVAVVIQALLFGLFHLYTWGLFTSLAVFNSINAFMMGVILGAWRIKFRSLLPLILAHALCNVPATIGLITDFSQALDRSRPKYTVTEQTTHVTGPLKKGGFVDYVAALNERFSRDVTPENNAAVPFWKAVGPGEILPEYRKEYFRMLGIPPLDEEGDYFIDFDDYVKGRKNDTAAGEPAPGARAQNDAQDAFSEATKRPWSPEEFPILSEWLAANGKPLATVVEASRRPRRFDPLVCKEDTLLIGVRYPALQRYYDVVEALCARAMLRLHEGRVKEAWEDLLACHRLARLVGQGPTLVDTVRAFSCERTACAGDQTLLGNTPLTASQIAKMRADLNRLLPLPKAADKLDVAERFVYLDTVSGCSRRGIASLAEIAAPEMIELDPELNGLKGTIELLIQQGADTQVDWDCILWMGNLWYDRLVGACRKPTRAERKEALDKIDEDFRRLRKTAENVAILEEAIHKHPRQAISVRFGEVVLSIMFVPWGPPLEAQDCWIMRVELNNLAFALAAYRADHAAYPEKLADLVPGYVPQLPDDFFRGSTLHYRREGTDYLLYSVGPNGKDDGGKGMEDREEGEEWDDVSVQMTTSEEAPQARH